MALIVVDPQKSFCDPDGSMAKQGRPIAEMAAAARAGDELADAARAAGVIVIWTRMVFAQSVIIELIEGAELVDLTGDVCSGLAGGKLILTNLVPCTG